MMVQFESSHPTMRTETIFKRILQNLEKYDYKQISNIMLVNNFN